MKVFIEFLEGLKPKYNQVSPLNDTEKGQNKDMFHNKIEKLLEELAKP
jgi:hypothetical protein